MGGFGMKAKKESAREARMKRKMETLARVANQNKTEDVDGGYTGMSRDGSPPVQDADDL
jgi:hypothetical protein